MSRLARQASCADDCSSSLTTLVVYAPQSSASPASAYQETGSPTAAGPAALAGLTSTFLLSDTASTDLATTGSDTPAASPSGFTPAVNVSAASATDPKHSGDLGRAQAGTRMGLLGLVWGVLAMGVL